MTEEVETVDQGVVGTESLGGKYLTFFLGEEEYGIVILKLREIIGIMDITSIPSTPGFIRGVINLRGKIIPVVDLRLKFGMQAVEQTDETCIIVVQTGSVVIGILVDRVSEVLDIEDENIDDAPSFGVEVEIDYILGIGKSGERIMLLLDIDRVLSAQEALEIELATADGRNPGSF